MIKLRLALVLLFAWPGVAEAAPFGDLPFQRVPDGAFCVRDTGAPGELTRWVPGGVEVMQASREGLRAGQRVPLGRMYDCPAVAADAGGAAVLAAPTSQGLRIALREPGAPAFGVPVTVPARRIVYEFDAAISARGDVVVAWGEYDGRRTRVWVARRPAGGAFSAPEELAPRSRDADNPGVDVGISGDGEALVMFRIRGGDEFGGRAVRLASARPGAPFAVRTISSGSAALAVAPDGRALLVVHASPGLLVYERAPGADFPAEPQPIETGSMVDPPALDLRADGSAAIAWRESEEGPIDALVRHGPVAFGRPVRIAPDPRPERTEIPGFGISPIRTDPPNEPDTVVRARLGADGRALLVWPTREDGLEAATLTAAGRVERTRLSSPLRTAVGLTPLPLADGVAAVAWAEAPSGFPSGGSSAWLLRLALEGAAAAPAAPAPRISVGAPSRRALRPAQSFVLPVRCSAACDVRVTLPGAQQYGSFTGSLSRAGTLALRLRPLNRALARRDGRPLQVRLRYGAPGARTFRTQTFPVNLRRLPAPPFPRIQNLRARRSGDTVVVRWTTDVPARDIIFIAVGLRGRSRNAEALGAEGIYGAGRRRFRMVLRDAARVRYVRFSAGQTIGRREDERTLRVTDS